MRVRIFTAAVLLLSAAPVVTPAFAEDCTAPVAAAFEKQRTTKAYRVVSKQPSPRGEITSSINYITPDKMHQTLVVPDEPAPLETIAIGKWAWANQGGGFQELQPQFAQTVVSHVTATLGTPTGSPEPFTCLGKVTKDGKELLAYRTEPKAGPGKPVGPENPLLARTVHIDAVTGLPVTNFVSEPSPDAVPLFIASFSYPTDIAIVAPDAIPAGRTR
jgi:hypothetical protein